MTPDAVAETARIGARIIKDQTIASDTLWNLLVDMQNVLPPQMTSSSGGYAPGNKPFVLLLSDDYDAPVDAISAWMNQLLDYIRDNPGDMLWWHGRPMVRGDVDCVVNAPRWRVCARCAMGDAP